jgi:ATP-dependent Clp protease ATP-binding subunit ClpA
VLDRFTETAKKIVSEAKEIAESLNHQEINNEHLIRAIQGHDQCLAWKMIQETGTPLDAIERSLESVLIPSDTPSHEHIGFNEHVKKAIEKAYLYTESSTFSWISSALILLGILESGSRISERLLHSWGLSPELLTTRIKDSGDLPGSEEKVEPIPEFDQKFLDLSGRFSEDAQKILTHAQQLAKTYKNHTLNVHHLFLSLAFLGSRGIINIDPLDSSHLDLDRIKKFIADKLGPEIETDDDIVLFSRDVMEILQIAVQEAFQFCANEVKAIHITLGMLVSHPAIFTEATDLSYLFLKRLLNKEQLKPEQQVTIKTLPVTKTVHSNYPHISLRRYNADPGAVITIPQKFAEEWNVIALNQSNNVLTIAMLNPADESVVQKVRELSGMEVSILSADESDLKAAFKMYY